MRKMIPVFLAMVVVAAVMMTGCNKIEMAELEPGLSFVDSLVGTGELADAGDFVQVHYTGWLYVDGENGEKVKGEKFDSSHDRGEPIAFTLGQGRVIPGWDRGIAGMKIGGKRTLVIAPDLAYGARETPTIPANSTLIFDTELVGISAVDIEILEQGEGPKAVAGDFITAHYTGWLWEDGAKGEQFDSSSNSGRPFQFPLGAGRVIPGWDMAFDGMNVGTKARLIIPPELGYGSRGAGGAIPPNATLCFEVELVSTEKK